MALLNTGTHIHIHVHTDHDKEAIAALEKKIDYVISQNKIIMSKQETFDALLVRLNLTTNDIAADLKLLKEQIAAGTVSDESLAKLDANIAGLEALGASTENPVPEPPTV